MLSKEHFRYNIHKSPMKNSAYPPLINSPPYMDYLPYFYKRTLSPHPFMSRGLTLWSVIVFILSNQSQMKV